MREEYARTLPSSTVISELPLLARVIQVTAKIISENQGITPACAGNTRPCCKGCPRTRNYPRSRGEYISALVLLGTNMELPPLTRGIPHLLQGLQRYPWNYPSSRGEYGMYRPRAGFALELPSLTRGILRDSDYGCIVPGITPAHAGEYCKPSRFKSPRTELPPLTRGIPVSSSKIFAATELPPLTRGIRSSITGGD